GVRRARAGVGNQPGGGPKAPTDSPPPLAPGARAVLEAPCPRTADRLPRDRLHAPGPVALHVSPLLGGRRARPAAEHWLARPPARRDRGSRQRDAGPLPRLVAAPVARDREHAGRDADRP